MSGYGLLADVVLLLHIMFVLFIVGGQALILIGWARYWQWTRRRWFRRLHLAAIGLVALEAWIGMVCPLTEIENWLRRHAGETGYERGFIADWMQWLLYYDAPPWIFVALYTMFLLLVVFSYLLYPPRQP